MSVEQWVHEFNYLERSLINGVDVDEHSSLAVSSASRAHMTSPAIIDALIKGRGRGIKRCKKGQLKICRS